MVLSPYMADDCCITECLDTICARNEPQEKTSHKTRGCCAKTGIYHNENILMWHYTNPQNIFFSFLLPFVQARLDREPWMTFLEVELDSEDFESYSRITSLEEIPTFCSLLWLRRQCLTERKWEGRHTRVAAFPVLGFDFLTQSFWLDTDLRLSPYFSQKHINAICLWACYNSVL